MQTRTGPDASRSAVPPLPDPYVHRPALTEALDAAAAGRLTVVTGGPGWGKTTAVAAWAAGRDACWVSLEAADAAVPRLANRILQALHPRLPALPAGLVIPARPAGTGPEPVRVDPVVDALSRLLAEHLRGDLVLVLADLHELAGPDGVRLVAGVAEQGPPGLHLVVLTEPPADPAGGPGGPDGMWPELAAANRLGPDRLVYTAAEVAAFLAAVLGGPDPAAARAVWAATGGWPAAVRLAAELLRVGGAAGRRALAGLRPGGRVLAELAALVLAGEPEPNRQLLATVAVLGRVDAALCEALGHRPAATLLPALARHGLLRPDGPDHRSWSLLGPARELLGTGADPARARPVQARAAAYRTGRAEYALALRHLVAAGDRAGATALLVGHGEALLAEGEVGSVLAAAEQLDLRGPDPHLLAVLGYARQLAGDWLGALALLRAAAGGGRLAPVLALRLGQLYYVSGQPEEAIGAFERARTGVGSSEEIQLLGHAATWLRAVGQDDRARATANRAAVEAERRSDPVGAARSHWALAAITAHDGDRAGHDMHYRRGLRLAGQGGDQLMQLGLQINHASYLAEEGPPAEALAEAESALRLGQALGVVGYEPLCLSIRARAKARMGQFVDALADVDASRLRWQDIGPSFDVAFGLVVRGYIHRRRGEPGQAEAALEEALRAADTGGMRPVQALALANLARARAADDLDSAGELAERAVAVATGTGKVPARIARGWVALLAGDRATANRDAAEARSVAGARRDMAGLAEGLELAVLAGPDPPAAVRLLDEAAEIWADLGDPVGEARVRLVAARLAGPTGRPAADAALVVLHRYGLHVDSGVADALAVPAPQPPIVVRTLGEFQVLRDGVPIPSTEWRSKKARDLFKILVTYRGRPAARERLVSVLWPDDQSDRTGNRLSVLLSTLRTVLDPDRVIPEPGPVRADRDTVALDLALIAVDVETFLSLAATAQAADRQAEPAAVGLLTAAEAAYTGEFLPEDRYDEWAEPLRDAARTTCIAVLRALVRHLADPDRREHHLLRLLDHDPYDEQAHRLLVQTLQAAGRHGEANRRYAAYVERMTEIGITPAAL